MFLCVCDCVLFCDCLVVCLCVCLFGLYVVECVSVVCVDAHVVVHQCVSAAARVCVG